MVLYFNHFASLSHHRTRDAAAIAIIRLPAAFAGRTFVGYSFGGCGFGGIGFGGIGFEGRAFDGRTFDGCTFVTRGGVRCCGTSRHVCSVIAEMSYLKKMLSSLEGQGAEIMGQR